MQDIQHILYNTVCSDFEKYLQGEDMLVLSCVSKTTRDGELTTNFRKLLIHTMEEYREYERNNNIILHNAYKIDNFFANIPLRVIYKNVDVKLVNDIYRLLDYLNIDDQTRIHISIELESLDNFKKHMDKSNSDEDERFWEYLMYVEQASIRLRPDIVQYLYSDRRVEFNMNDTERYFYYPITQELRDVFILNEKEYINILREQMNMNDPNEFGLIPTDWDRAEHLLVLLCYATCFQEQDKFIEYYTKYRGNVPKNIRNILYDKNLKYNIDRYHSKLLEYNK